MADFGFKGDSADTAVSLCGEVQNSLQDMLNVASKALDAADTLKSLDGDGKIGEKIARPLEEICASIKEAVTNFEPHAEQLKNSAAGMEEVRNVGDTDFFNGGIKNMLG